MHNILKIVPQDSFLISILFSLVLSLPFNVLLLSADFLENQGQSYSKSLAHLSRLWCSQLRGSSFFPLVLGSSKFVWMCFLTTFCFFPTGRQLKFSGCTVDTDTHSASSLTVQPQTKKINDQTLLHSSESRQANYSSNAVLLHTYKAASYLLKYTSLQVFSI